MEFKHKSVLLKETIDNLKVKPDGIYVDGTLGGAGHASEVCKLLSATGRLIGIDQDDAAIQAASERLRDYQDRTMIIRSNYCHMVPADGSVWDLEKECRISSLLWTRILYLQRSVRNWERSLQSACFWSA